MIRREQWEQLDIETATLYLGSIIFVGIFIWGLHYSWVISFGTMVSMNAMWFGISLPLIYMWGRQSYTESNTTEQIRKLEDKYYVAEFGAGAVIPTWNVARQGLQSVRDAQVLTGTVVMSLEDAVKYMSTDKHKMDTWVVRPKYKGGWKYAYNSYSKYATHGDLPWKKLKKPKPLKDLAGVISNVGKKNGTEYRYNTNNCQHFAEAMFDFCN